MAEIFENSKCWQKAKELCLETYRLLPKLPHEETYALKDQLRRAAVSIPSNIAEGLSRQSIKEQFVFINIAIGSTYEVMTQVDISMELNYLNKEDKEKIFEISNQALKLMNGYKRFMRENDK